jgi:hypothetical protein
VGGRDYSKDLLEAYEEGMSGADGINKYILKIETYTCKRMKKDINRHREELEHINNVFCRYENPNWWRTNNTVKGGDHTGMVGETADGIAINKTDTSKGARIFFIRYSDEKTGKTYVQLLGYLRSSDHDDWHKEVQKIIQRKGGKVYDEEKPFNPDGPIDVGNIIIEDDAKYIIETELNSELTDHSQALLFSDANITITRNQFKTIARKPPLLIDGHAGTGKSIIIALRVALQYRAHDKHYKETRDVPKLVVVAYNQRVLDMIKEYTEYWMDRLIDDSDQYKERITYIPTLKLYHQLVSKTHHAGSIPDPMSIGKGKVFVTFYKFENDFFATIDEPEISAEQAWHFIRGIMKGQRFGWFGERKITIKDFSSVFTGGIIPRKLTALMSKELIVKQLMIFNEYEKWRINNDLMDDIDLVRRAFTAIGAKEENDRPYNEELLNSFDDIFVDEAQDLTSVEFELLTKLLSKEPTRIVVAGDPLQTINPTGFSWTSLETFLYQLVSGDSVNKSERMLVSHRLPKKLVDFSNIIIEARGQFKGEETNLMQPADKIRNDGFVAKIPFDPSNVAEREIMEDILRGSLASNIGVLLWARDSSELYDITQSDEILKGELDNYYSGNKPQFDIHSIESVKGLEYESIILYRFGDLVKQFDEITMLSLSKDESKDLENDDQYRVLYHLNRLFIAASRSKTNIYIIDGKDSIESAWATTLWNGKIEHVLTVEDLKEQIDLTPTLDKARNYFEKGKDTDDLNLIRKALASASKCEPSKERTDLMREIDIVRIRLEIAYTPESNKEKITLLQGQLVVIFEDLGRSEEAVYIRAEMGEWDDIRKKYKQNKKPKVKLLWNLSNLEEKYPDAKKSLIYILDHVNVWNMVIKEQTIEFRKTLKQRLRAYARMVANELKAERLKELLKFGFQKDDLVDLLEINWDKTTSNRIRINEKLAEEYANKVVQIIGGEPKHSLSAKAYIEYLDILLANPTLPENKQLEYIKEQSEKGHKKAMGKHLWTILGKAGDQLDDHVWPRIKTIIDNIDDLEFPDDHKKLILRINRMCYLREMINASHFQMDTFDKAITAFKHLSSNPELTGIASGLEIFSLGAKGSERGDIYDKFNKCVLKISDEQLNAVASKLTRLFINKQTWSQLVLREDIFSKLKEQFNSRIPKDIIELVEKAFFHWTIGFDSKYVNPLIQHIFGDTLKEGTISIKGNINQLKSKVKFAKSVQDYIKRSDAWYVFWDSEKIVDSAIWGLFDTAEKEKVQFCIQYKRWKKSGDDAPPGDGGNFETLFGLAKKWNLTEIAKDYGNASNLDADQVAGINMLSFECEVTKIKNKTISEILQNYSKEEFDGVDWKKTKWFSAQSIPVDISEIKKSKLTAVEVHNGMIYYGNLTPSFTQTFLHLLDKEFNQEAQLSNPLKSILRTAHQQLDARVAEETAKDLFWEYALRAESCLDNIKPTKRSNNTNLALAAFMETILVWNRLTNKERISFLKNIGVSCASSKKKNEVVDLLLKQYYIKCALKELEEFEHIQELTQSLEDLLNR